MQANITEWDERNNVAVRYIEDAGSMEHSAVEDLEYVVASRQSGGLPIRCLYSASKSETLIVAFHGSLQRTKFPLPRFEWRRTLQDVGTGRLFVADTTLELHEGMPLGWYIGTAGQNLAEEIASFIQQVADEGGYRRVVLTGSSGGGFAAMAVSRRVPGSVAVSFSPQTRVGDYVPWVYQALVRAAFPGYASIAEVETECAERVNLCRLYAEPEIPNYVRYVQNSKDPVHLEKHYAPFAAARLVDGSDDGLDPSGRVRLVLEEMQDGHHPPSRGRFLQHIQEAYEEFFQIPWSDGPRVAPSFTHSRNSETDSRREPVESAAADGTTGKHQPALLGKTLLRNRFSAAVCGIYALCSAGVVLALTAGSVVFAAVAVLLIGMLIIFVQLDIRHRTMNNHAVVREQMRVIRMQANSMRTFLDHTENRSKYRYNTVSRRLAGQSKQLEQIRAESADVLAASAKLKDMPAEPPATVPGKS